MDNLTKHWVNVLFSVGTLTFRDRRKVMFRVAASVSLCVIGHTEDSLMSVPAARHTKAVVPC